MRRVSSSFARSRPVHTASANDCARDRLRALLRETAQSVAVVTALLPPSPSSASPAFHGATLSSFTTIALYPRPLVAFSLRVPSRMASALNACARADAHADARAAHLVVNLLSAAQPDLAHRFSRPDLHPHPFADPRVRYSPSARDGLPVLAGTLGALVCRLVGPSLPLAHLPFNDGGGGGELTGEGGRGAEKVQHTRGETELASELFIASVLCVEHIPFSAEDEQESAGLHKLPLVYHRRRYTTVKESDP